MAVSVVRPSEWAAAGISEEDIINGVVLAPSGYVYVPPAPSKQLTIDLQVSVTECTSWQEVLAVVDSFGDIFDFRNTSTAIHRVARFSFNAGETQLVLADWRFPRLLQLIWAKCSDLSPWGLSDATWGLAKLQCRNEDIFRRLSARARHLIKEIDPQGLSLIAWSFATVGLRDDELMAAIADESQRKLDTFGAQNIANLIWATATAGIKADALHAALVKESLRRLSDFTSQELAIVNWSLTKLAYPVDDVWRTAFRNRVMQLKEYAPSEVSMIAWALATRGDYDPELMAYIARRSIELMRSFTGQNLATVIWAMATVSYKDDPSVDEFLRMALGAIIARSGEFQPLNIALISWGLAKLSYQAEVAFEALCAAAVEQMNNFVPQNLVQLVWACATNGYKNDSFLAAAGRVAKLRMDDFSSQHLSNLLWAYARLGYDEDHGLLRAIGHAAVRRMHEGTPQHLSNMAWAISQLGPEHFTECLSKIVAETAARLVEFDPPSLMMLSDSLFEANYGRGQHEPLLDILRGHVVKMGDTLLRIFTEDLPPRRGVAAPSQILEYQRKLRSVGLVTFGYEHTASLFAQLRLAEGRPWEAAEAKAMPGWTTNARRTTAARRYVVVVGSDRIEDAGTIFTSAFASAAEDSACEFPVVWLGQGKADSPSSGRAGRSGDAECRAMVDTHMTFRRLMQERGVTAVSGEVSFHTSGVPCLSCVGVATQFKRCYPQVAFNFTFSPREVVEGPDVAVAVAPHTPRLVPGAPSDGAAGKGKGKAAASADPLHGRDPWQSAPPGAGPAPAAGRTPHGERHDAPAQQLGQAHPAGPAAGTGPGGRVAPGAGSSFY